MPKSSPSIKSFSGGEFSTLVEGRTDLDRYPSSMRKMLNYVAAPQGPAICRSGTMFLGKQHTNTVASAMIDFIVSNEDAYALEFADQILRFWTEDGLLVRGATPATAIIPDANLKLTIPMFGGAVGDRVIFSGLPSEDNVNAVEYEITAKLVDDYTFNTTYSPTLGLPVGGLFVALVYQIDTPFLPSDVPNIQSVQSVDVAYMLAAGHVTKTLSRHNTYDWRLEDLQYLDGPYQAIDNNGITVQPDATGSIIPLMTSDTLPNGVASASSGADPYKAFDQDPDTYWESGANQAGILAYHPVAPFAAKGYAIHLARDNSSASFLPQDYGPSTFTFEGFDGADWHVLDSQVDYVLYDNFRSTYFELNNTVVYEDYRLNVKNVTRNGVINPRVAGLIISSVEQQTLDLVFSSIANINGGLGFVAASDIGRLIRLQGSDGIWRAFIITAVTNTSTITVTPQKEPLPDTDLIANWRLGYFSVGTGYPTVGTFFEDRLWLSGLDKFPGLIVGSVTGDYPNFAQTDLYGVVLDDSAIVIQLNARKLSNVRWLIEDVIGLLAGTGAGEFIVPTNSDGSAVTSRTARGRGTTSQGSAANIPPVKIDSQVLLVHRSHRTVRELAYVFESDGYKAPSMSQLASHIGISKFVQIEYAAEPHSIAWVRRLDESVVGLTYNREEGVIGWHRENFADAAVTHMTVIPSVDQLQDNLIMCTSRDVNAITERYVEVLTRFWDFDMTIADAHFVDCALRYNGTPVQTIYGLQHLEGEDIYGLADGIPFGPKTVTGGSITLTGPAGNIIAGLGYEAEAETSRLEAGAADGTAQGKTKRWHNSTVLLWASSGGQIGIWNEQEKETVWNDIDYQHEDIDEELDEPKLFSGIVGPITNPPDYGDRGSISFRKRKEDTLPFNVVSIMPQGNTQDR